MNIHHIDYRSRCLTAGGQAAPRPPPSPTPPAPAQRFIINSHVAGSSLDSQNVPPKTRPRRPCLRRD